MITTLSDLSTLTGLKETYEAYKSQYKRSFQHNLLFTHIPLQEYREVENIKEFHGIFNEPIACSKINSGLFSQMLLNGDIEGMFCGHDHDNDFTINLYGIRLSFGRVGIITLMVTYNVVHD